MSKELTKRLVEKMLNSEMQNYLGYEKNRLFKKIHRFLKSLFNCIKLRHVFLI
ncbi:hypothetical protein [Spiroplasma ixodetis]|uniref:hypothetical protein n=1 Tax=Spiroplasma ixodetis TaxID=2141 RepID=UPI00333EC1D9